MSWKVFKFFTSWRRLESIMILVVLGFVGVTYYAVVLTSFGPVLFSGGTGSVSSVVMLVLFHCLLVMLLWSYFAVVFTNPGIVPPNWKPAVDQERGEVDPSNQLFGHCRICNELKPARCHLCSKCGRCVLKMDHHCKWVANCVGALNYKYFLLFLFYTFLEATLVAISLGLYFKTLSMDEEISASSVTLAITFFAFVLNLGNALGAMSFLILHISLVAANITTIESYQWRTNPRWHYDLGCRKNFEQVFGMDKRYWFIPTYSQDMRRMPVLQGLEYPSRSGSGFVFQEFRQPNCHIT